jgi:hypothetical protein
MMLGRGITRGACIPHYNFLPMEGFGPLEIYPTKLSDKGAAVENEMPQWVER